MPYAPESIQPSVPRRLAVLSLDFAVSVLLFAWAAVIVPLLLALFGVQAEYGRLALALMVVLLVGVAASLALRALRSFGFDFGGGANPLSVVSVVCPLAAVAVQTALAIPFMAVGLPATGEVHDDAVELGLSVLITVAMFAAFALMLRKWDFGRGFALAFCAMHELDMLGLLPSFAINAVSLVTTILAIPFVLIGAFIVIKVAGAVARSWW